MQRTRSSPSARHSPLMRCPLGAATFIPWFLASVLIAGCSSIDRSSAKLGLQCDAELFGSNYPIKRSWLRQQVTLQEADALIRSLSEPGQQNPLLEEWLSLTKTLQAGDQVWMFSGCPLPPPAEPPPPDAMILCGDVGYVLIRGCRVLGKVVYQES